MVKALHRAGIEVILDVVYNHTAEGNHLGPMLVVQGHRQRLVLPPDAGRPEPLHGLHRHRQQPQPGAPERAAADHGLAALLGHRVPRRRLPLRPRLGAGARALRRRPAVGVLRRHPPGSGALAGEADRRAVGSRPGRLPGRQLPRAVDGVERPLPRHDARLLARRRRASPRSPRASPARATSTRPTAATRRPRSTSSPRTTASRSPTSSPTTQKHNEANGEDNRDGTDDNRSWNCGVEGPTEDPEVLALRELQQRNFLATLLLSQGVPMLLGRRRDGRTQRGNNNAWCQDNEISWSTGSSTSERAAARVHAPPSRAASPASDLPPHGVPERRGLAVGPARRLVVPARRQADERGRLAEHRRARARRVPERRGIGSLSAEGEPIVDSSFILLLNAHHEDIAFSLPPRRFGTRWQVELSTAYPRAPAIVLTARGAAHVSARSLLLLRQPEACRPPARQRRHGQSCTVAPETREEELVAAKTVVLVGTLDTKGREYAFLRERLRAAGVGTILVDAGIMGQP